MMAAANQQGPFVETARNFLRNPGQYSLAKHPNLPIMQSTIRFLLENRHVGRQNAVSTDRILDHLQGLGHRIHREKWQTSVLGPLRENRVFIGSVIGRGMFIIADEADARAVLTSYRTRIRSETRRRNLLRELAHLAGWQA